MEVQITCAANVTKRASMEYADTATTEKNPIQTSEDPHSNDNRDVSEDTPKPKRKSGGTLPKRLQRMGASTVHKMACHFVGSRKNNTVFFLMVLIYPFSSTQYSHDILCVFSLGCNKVPLAC